MTDIPIIFSAPMVRALLREVERPGTGKTETRRLLYVLRKVTEGRALSPTMLSGYPPIITYDPTTHFPTNHGADEYFTLTGWHKVQAGDRLWVRENFSGPRSLRGEKPYEWLKHGMVPPIWYWADDDPEDGDWTKPKPSIHMPRWASRLTLIVKSVKIERLQDIDETAAKREGVKPAISGVGLDGPIKSHRTGFVYLWGSLHGANSWLDDPFVVAISFRVIKANIDAPEARIAA